MATLDETVDTYVAAVSATDGAVRRSVLERCVSEDFEFWGVAGQARGREAFACLLEDLQSQSATPLALVRTTAIDSHHGWFRFAWEFRGPDGTAVLAGVDIGQVGDDGRIKSLVVFFNTPASTGS